MLGSDSRDESRAGAGWAVSDRGRRLGLAVIGLVCLAEFAYAGWDVSRRTAAEEARITRGLEQTTALAQRLYLAELQSIDARMERLRGRVRGLGIWDDPELGQMLDQETEQAPQNGPESDESDRSTLRLLASLEHALDQWPGAASLDIVVAGHQGLWAQHIDHSSREDRTTTAPGRSAEAKALWYDEQVRRAVDSGGRGIEHGELHFEAPELEHGELDRPEEDALEARAPTPIMRVAIALHQPGEIVQGALVVSLNATHWAAPIERTAPEGVDLILVTPAGERLVPSSAPDESGRYAALVARVLEAESTDERIEADDQWIVGAPLSPGGDALATLVAFAATRPPLTGPMAWLSTSHPVAWAGLAVISLVAGAALMSSRREQVVHYELVSTDNDEVSDRDESARASLDAAQDSNDARIELDPSAFRIHDWLADVRACLEREAARRGLGLSLRCERGVPDEFTSDPAWLGGLVLALGREALDATDNENVVLDVYEERAGALRFEIAAGSIALAPVSGMEEIASEMGGGFESGRDGRLSLIVPSTQPAH